MSDLEQRLIEIVRNYPDLMHVMTAVRSLDLPDWLIFSGSVYQSVWNAQTGREPGYGVNDFDLGYFDTDTSWDAEDVVIKRVAAAFDEPLRSRVEARNQCRVPIWFRSKFGEDYDSIACTAEALPRFVAPAFAVGVRLEADDSITIVAPFGLEDAFDLVVRPNPDRPLAKDWAKIATKIKTRWPEVSVAEVQVALTAS